MPGLLRRLLGRTAGPTETGRRPRRDSAVYALELRDGRPRPGTLRRLSPDGDFTQPMISSCGTRVAYWGAACGGAAPRIWISKLEADPAAVQMTAVDGMQGHPYWHPDGVRLVHFVSAASTWDPRLQFSTDRAPARLCWLDTSTGTVTPLTEGPYTDERPAVSPDGRAVVFVSNRSGRLNLWRVDSNGGGPVQLTNGAGPDYRPCISPDGQRLAYFTSIAGGSHQVRILDLSTGREWPADWTERFTWSHGPFWCGNGSALLVHGLERNATSPALWRVDLGSGQVHRLDTPGLASASHGTMDAAERWLVCDSRAG